MKTTELKQITDFEKIITLKENENDTINYVIIDYNDEKNTVESSTVENEMKKEINIDDIKKDFISTVVKLSEEDDAEIIEKFTFKDSDFTDNNVKNRKLIAKINNACNYIAANGRIGAGKIILLSEKTFNKYKDAFDLYLNDDYHQFLFDDSINDIIVYRKNTIEQPGLILVYNKEKYSFESIGFYPERQFLKITLN